MAPTFKDLIRADIHGAFFNLEEFGEEHDINGTPIACIVDDNEMVEREKRGQVRYRDGTYARQVMMYVAARDFGPLPAIGRRLLLDGKGYAVMDSIDEDGIYSISLEAVRS